MLKVKTKGAEELPRFQQIKDDNNQQNQTDINQTNLNTKLNIVYTNSLSEQLPEKDFNPFIKSRFKYSLFTIKTSYFKNNNNTEPKIKIDFDDKNKAFKLSLNGETEKLDLNNLVNCYIDLKQVENNDNSKYLLIKQLFFYGDIINENNELLNNNNIINFCLLLDIDKIKTIIENQNFDLASTFIKNLILIIVDKLKKLINNQKYARPIGEKNIIDLLINILSLQIEINNLMIQQILKNNQSVQL